MRNLAFKCLGKLTGLRVAVNLYLTWVSNINLSMTRRVAVRVLVWFLNRNIEYARPKTSLRYLEKAI
jgi:hypothetical protein